MTDGLLSPAPLEAKFRSPDGCKRQKVTLYAAAISLIFSWGIAA